MLTQVTFYITRNIHNVFNHVIAIAIVSKSWKFQLETRSCPRLLSHTRTLVRLRGSTRSQMGRLVPGLPPSDTPGGDKFTTQVHAYHRCIKVTILNDICAGGIGNEETFGIPNGKAPITTDSATQHADNRWSVVRWYQKAAQVAKEKRQRHSLKSRR